MKASDLPSHDEVLAEQLKDPEFRQEWDRSAFARAVAQRVIAYRVEHSLSQAELGKRLRMAQSAVARLESGDREPSLGTLARLARRLGIEFHIDITPTRFQVMTAGGELDRHHLTAGRDGHGAGARRGAEGGCVA